MSKGTAFNTQTGGLTGHLPRAVLVGSLLSLGLFSSLLLETTIPHAYLLLLTAACGLAGWFLGRGYGVLSGMLSGVLVVYFVLNPMHSFRLSSDEVPSAVLLLVAAIGAGFLSGEWRWIRDHLEESREQFRSLLDGVKDHAVFLLDPEGRIVTWHTGAQRITGYAANEVLQKPHSIFFPAEELAQDKPQALLRDAAKNGTVQVDGHRVRKDGTRFWAEIAINTLYGDDGSVRGYAETTRDVSELRAKQEALEAREEVLRAVVDNAPDAVLLVNESGTILFANAGAASMFGYSLTELLGEKIETLVPAAKRSAHTTHREGFQTEPQRRPMGMGLDLCAVKRDGTEFPVEINLGPVESSLERRFVASVRDITDRKLMEQELQGRQIQEPAQLMIRDL